MLFNILVAINCFRRTRLGSMLRVPFFVLGNICRWVGSRYLPEFYVKKNIGSFGPFLIHSKFIFSDFESWGNGHNACFNRLLNACQGRQCVLDIGAHIGLYTLPISSVIASNGLVHAFEPAEANIIFLNRHVELNNLRNVVLVKKLLWDEDDATLSFEESKDVSGINRIIKSGSGMLFCGQQITTVDRYSVDQNIVPEIIKIDVEGAELNVLRGARETLMRCNPLLCLSVHSKELEDIGSSATELWNYIDDLNYCVFSPQGVQITERSNFKSGEYLVTKRKML